MTGDEIGPPYRVGGHLGGWDQLHLERDPESVLHPMDPTDVVEPDFPSAPTPSGGTAQLGGVT